MQFSTMMHNPFVIPAKAGIHIRHSVPAHYRQSGLLRYVNFHFNVIVG